MKIVNFKKFRRTVLILVTIITLLIIILGKNTYSKGETSYKSEFIISGDTLWSIAEKESKSNKYYEDKDIRYIIYDLKQINNLTDSNLKEGQEIKIPTL